MFLGIDEKYETLVYLFLTKIVFYNLLPIPVLVFSDCMVANLLKVVICTLGIFYLHI